MIYTFTSLLIVYICL